VDSAAGEGPLSRDRTASRRLEAVREFESGEGVAGSDSDSNPKDSLVGGGETVN
jgi:hypothetical protein